VDGMGRFLIGTFIVGFLIGCLLVADWMVQAIYQGLRGVGL